MKDRRDSSRNGRKPGKRWWLTDEQPVGNHAATSNDDGPSRRRAASADSGASSRPVGFRTATDWRKAQLTLRLRWTRRGSARRRTSIGTATKTQPKFPNVHRDALLRGGIVRPANVSECNVCPSGVVRTHVDDMSVSGIEHQSSASADRRAIDRPLSWLSTFRPLDTLAPVRMPPPPASPRRRFQGALSEIGRNPVDRLALGITVLAAAGLWALGRAHVVSRELPAGRPLQRRHHRGGRGAGALAPSRTGAPVRGHYHHDAAAMGAPRPPAGPVHRPGGHLIRSDHDGRST
jgi:hypothetical protein